MKKYYELTDKSHQIYAAATFLNPTQRRDFFDSSWISQLRPWVLVMLANCRDIWERDYARKKIKQRDAFEDWLYRKKQDDSVSDEFSKIFCSREKKLPLRCPATSCECERAFSSAKLLIAPERNSLGRRPNRGIGVLAGVVEQQVG
jgi:hypothetical protein